MYICICHGITDHQIRSCVKDGATSLCDLSGRLGVATQCGSCAESAMQIVHQTVASAGTESTLHTLRPSQPGLSSQRAAA